MSTDFFIKLADWSQIAGSLVFVAGLVWVFGRYVVPAVRSSQERKNGELADAEKRRDDAKADAEHARVELAAAGVESTAIGERSERDAVHERERIIADANAEGDRLLRNARGELERSRYAGRAKLREELIDKAVSIAREGAQRMDGAESERVNAGVLDAIGREGG